MHSFSLRWESHHTWHERFWNLYIRFHSRWKHYPRSHVPKDRKTDSWLVPWGIQQYHICLWVDRLWQDTYYSGNTRWHWSASKTILVPLCWDRKNVDQAQVCQESSCQIGWCARDFIWDYLLLLWNIQWANFRPFRPPSIKIADSWSQKRSDIRKWKISSSVQPPWSNGSNSKRAAQPLCSLYQYE